jgi:hypothetical protein
MNVVPQPCHALRLSGALSTLLLLSVPFVASAATPAASDADLAAFTDRYCSSCHNDVDKEGGLDLTIVNYEPNDPANFMAWVKVHDRVQSGEMPPKEKKRPAAAELSAFLGGLSSQLIASERAVVTREGRAARRRLNGYEYENSLRDLLHTPWIAVKDQLPEDGEAYKFNKVSNALDVSFVHMSRYMSAADYAMRQAMAAEFVRPETTTHRIYARDNFYSGPTTGDGVPDRQKFPVIGLTPQRDVRMLQAPSTGDATRDVEAMGWISSNYVTGFGSNWDNYNAPVSGKYRLRFSGYTLWVGTWGFSRRLTGTGAAKAHVIQAPEWHRPDFDQVSEGRRNEPVVVYAKGATNRRISGFDLTPEPAVAEAGEVWLQANDTIVTDTSRFFRSRPTGFRGGYTNPLAQRDGMPAAAFRWMEVEGPLYDENSGAGYRLLFGDLKMKKTQAGQPGVQIDVVSEPPAGRGGRFMKGGQIVFGGLGNQYGGGQGRNRTTLAKANVEVETANPKQDAERLLRNFMAKVYRRPVEEAHVQIFLKVIQQRLDAGLGFAAAMLAGYTGVLSSPEFVYLDEKPGRLDDNALATRLALFLWNAGPDEALRKRAASGELHRPEVLKAETARLLADPKAQRFVDAFLDYWLEVRRMEETTPSTALYNDYYLDDSLTEAALDETRMFFAEMLRGNLPARNVVASDFTFLNERLATHYGISGVDGVKMRRVALPKDSPRGGFMTQASVLKVTANGTTTSPVVRGKWIMERIVGVDMPLPPASVPAVEPDIRGAVTIRQQLDKHRADESCAMCHRKIDAPGFALESFDVMGAWRDRYRAMAVDTEPAHGFGKNGWPYAFYFGLPVDASGELTDGRSFKDVRDFKKLILADETQIARNLARQLSVYATGSPVRFSDRAAIEQILATTKSSNYGVRSIVEAIIQSDLFLNK